MKKLKIIIVIFIIAIIMIITSILLLKNKQEEIPEIIEVKEEIAHASEEEDLTDTVKDQSKFFTASSCVSQYLDLINIKSSIYYGYDENEQYVQIMDPKEAIQEVLAKPQKQIKALEEKVKFTPMQMRMIENDNTEKYLVYGIVTNLDNEYKGDIYTFVTLCPENATFSIETIEEKPENINEIKFTNEEGIIEEKNYNTYEEVEVDNEYLCKQYFDMYKTLMLTKPEMAYEKLEEEYKNQRFGDILAYKKYIEDNKEEMESLQISKYLVNNYEEYTQYVGKNKYENVIIFDEKGLMDFTIKLDTYTIPTDKFKTTYNSGNEEKKVTMNIDKWVDMLNNRDYKAAYNVLNETFRNNKFKTEEDFANYMKENYPLHYKLEFSTFSGDKAAYVQKIKLTDITEEKEEQKELEIIMRLKEGTDFEMSFNVE